jgi:hypothetical protein
MTAPSFRPGARSTVEQNKGGYAKLGQAPSRHLRRTAQAYQPEELMQKAALSSPFAEATCTISAMRAAMVSICVRYTPARL